MQTTLDYISIKGFRSIRETGKLELSSINILVGANGSGKSNFVGAFDFLNVIRSGNLRRYTEERGGSDRILHFGSKITPKIEIEISFREGVNGYGISLSPTFEDLFYVEEESCWFWKKQYPQPYTENLKSTDGEAGISRHQTRKMVKWLQSRFDSWRIYHFHDTSDKSPMKRIADVDDNRFLRPDGSNLPAYLLFLKEKHLPAYRLICKMIRRVTPFVSDFQLAPLRRNESKIRLEWIHQNSDQYFDVSSLSDGTLRFICLATLLLQPPDLRPSAILLDEPELGLHPYAISMLASMIKSAATETQLIISTQSPLLLDRFEPEDVLVTELEEGATNITRLSPDKLEDWLEEYSLGQLWEKNQFGGRPTHG
ncbi:AAA family ATPase [Synechococcus sp. PCC 7336]|uniref:AAA family ATPase n=1 Tax=Synechococcus sp. PCC 7336 TaxID=195250 RepID=UPI00034DED66|nr:AAA family ATPase [Synechococcus sp. PCC 7336]